MNESGHYEICILGGLGDRWEEWFPGMALTREERDGKELTRLTGLVQDQGELMGILQTLANLGFPLLSVNRLERI